MAENKQVQAFVVVPPSMEEAAELQKTADKDSCMEMSPLTTEEESKTSARGPPEEASANGAQGCTIEEVFTADDLPKTRIEQLLEQQNSLMLRHLALAEENRKQNETMHSLFKKPSQILRSVDPCLRGLFKEWRKDFCSKLRLYVTESNTAHTYRKATANGELIKPFSGESQKSWRWTQFYRTIAKPIDAIDPILANGIPVGMADVDGNVRTTTCSPDHTNVFDIDAAFSELRKRHAQELQSFVIAHHKVCMEKITEELCLSYQVKTLQDKLMAYASEHNGLINFKSKQCLQDQAESFVEIVYREEMPKAEKQIKEGSTVGTFTVISLIRTMCVAALLLSVSCIDHERLSQLFAIAFALVCGLALLWEEPVLRGVQQLFGGVPQCLSSPQRTIAWSSDGLADLYLSAST
jgi:hypothetical protein